MTHPEPHKRLIRVREVATPELLGERLRSFEDRFGLSSADFLAGWREGTHPEWDTHEHFEWIGYCYLAVRQGLFSAPAPSATERSAA